MAGNAKKAAAAGAAVVAASGVAHFSGVFGDDALRGGTRVVENLPTPRPRPSFPTPRPRPPDNTLPPNTGAGVTEGLVREGEVDATSREVICFAYGTFYENGTLTLPSQEEFVTSVMEEVVHNESAFYTRLKANSLHSRLQGADLEGVAVDLGCEAASRLNGS